MSWFEANIDKRPNITEAPTQTLRDRAVDTTQVKQETQAQTAEHALPGPVNADMLSDLELFDSETFFMSRRRPQIGASNLGNMLAGASEVRGAERGMKLETTDVNVERAPTPRRRKGPYTSDPTNFDMNSTASQGLDEVLSPDPQPSKKRRIDSPASTK